MPLTRRTILGVQAVVALVLVILTACTTPSTPPTDTPWPTTPPRLSTGIPLLSEVWRPGPEVISREEDDIRYFATLNTLAKGRASDATLFIMCHRDLRVTEIVIVFDLPDWEGAMSTAQAQPAGRDRATAVARLRRGFALDDVFISRRNAGETGRWMKSGWQHGLTDSGKLRLWQTPAEAFIDQLAEVEELAVLVTDDYGENTSAVFDVRYLDVALYFDRHIGWDCALPDTDLGR